MALINHLSFMSHLKSGKVSITFLKKSISQLICCFLAAISFRHCQLQSCPRPFKQNIPIGPRALKLDDATLRKRSGRMPKRTTFDVSTNFPAKHHERRQKLSLLVGHEDKMTLRINSSNIHNHGKYMVVMVSKVSFQSEKFWRLHLFSLMFPREKF